MSIFELTRRSASQVRVLLVFLALALSLDIIAHAPHAHFKDGTQAVFCDYCVAFNAVADGPVQSAVLRAPVHAFRIAVPASTPLFSLRPETAAQPRAPPFHS